MRLSRDRVPGQPRERSIQRALTHSGYRHFPPYATGANRHSRAGGDRRAGSRGWRGFFRQCDRGSPRPQVSIHRQTSGTRHDPTALWLRERGQFRADARRRWRGPRLFRQPSVPRSTQSQAPFEQIAALYERTHFAIDHAALEHPETAVRMHVSQALRAEGLDNGLDTRGDEFGALHFVVLDIDHTDAEADLR